MVPVQEAVCSGPAERQRVDLDCPWGSQECAAGLVGGVRSPHGALCEPVSACPYSGEREN